MSFINEIKKSLGLENIIEPCFRAVLLGEESAYFENIRSIKSYSPLKIEIFLRKGLLTIEGEQLFIKKYCGGDLIVCGKIKVIIRT